MVVGSISTWGDEIIYLNLYFHFLALVSRQSAALSPATQHTMPPEFGRKWGTECLNCMRDTAWSWLLCGYTQYRFSKHFKSEKYQKSTTYIYKRSKCPHVSSDFIASWFVIVNNLFGIGYSYVQLVVLRAMKVYIPIGYAWIDIDISKIYSRL